MLCCNGLVELSLSKPEFPLAYFSALSSDAVHLKQQVKFFFFQGHWLIGVNKVPYLTQLLESWQLRLLCKYHNWLAIVFAKVYFELHSNSLFPFIFPFFGSCTELADKYHEGDLSFKSAWSYIVVINNCSQVVCIYFWENSNFAYYT